MATEVTMPKFGLNMNVGVVGKWLVENGQYVHKGQPILIVETDKVSNEVLAEEEGVLYHKVSAGDEVPVAAVVGLIVLHNEELTGTTLTNQETHNKNQEVKVFNESLESIPIKSSNRQTIASPAAKRRAKELGIDISNVQGSGEDGKVSIEDVDKHASRIQYSEKNTIERSPKDTVHEILVSKETDIHATPIARQMAAEFGIDLGELAHQVKGRTISRDDIVQAVKARMQPIEEIVRSHNEDKIYERSGIRNLIAKRMLNSVQHTAPVTLFTEVNATNLVQLRTYHNRQAEKRDKKKITYNDLLIYWAGLALAEYPTINSNIEGEEIVQNGRINIGVAVDTDQGLLVPVVKNVSEKNFAQIYDDLHTLIERARAGRCTLEDLEGGTFTITNLGMYGIDAFTPIINFPETAILGIGRIIEKPVGCNGQIILRNQLFLSLTFDHRLVDGAIASKFLQRLSDLLENDFPYMLS
jgi:pyruvate dehydrogenase E2 component (dihydrolipoamide acetyltransferase)